jgi:translocation and assembly module TamB
MMGKIWLKMKSFSRLKKIIFSVFLSLSIAIAVLSSLMFTETGSHWVVRKLATMVPIELGELHGNLLTGLDIASVNYHKDELSLHAEKISVRWQPLGLFYTAVKVQSLSAEKIRLHLPPTKTEPEPENYKWPSLAQPVRIELAQLHLRDVKVQQGEKIVPITTINGSLSLGTFHLRASDLTVANTQTQVRINGSMGLRFPYDLAIDADWQFDDKTIFAEKLSGKIKLSGDIKTLKLQQALAHPLQMNITGTLSPALHQPKTLPAADITLDWAEQPLPEAWANYVNLRLNPLARSTQMPAPQMPTPHVPTPASANLTQGHISLTGWLNAFKLKTQVQANLAVNKFVVVGVAQGNYSEQKKSLHAHLDKLNVLMQPNGASEQASNAFAVTGAIDGLHAWQWNLNFQTEHFNLNNVIENWPSDLHVALDVSGSFDPQKQKDTENGLNLALKNIDAHGDLRGLAVSARGAVEFDGEHWSSSDANLAVGANQLMLKGQAGNVLAVDWKINAPLLGQIDPAISGSIMSSGVISGDKANPRLQIKAQVNQFFWRDYAVDNLSLKLNPKIDTQEYDLLLDAAHMQLQAHTITHLTIKGTGTLAQHLVEGQMDSPDLGNASVKLSSSWQNEIWRGQWRDLVLNVKKIPRWSLASASPMEVNIQPNKKTADFGKLCLTSTANAPINKALSSINNSVQELPMMCLAGQWNSIAGLQVAGDLMAIPVNQLQAWFKPEAVLSGVVEGHLKLQVPVTKPLAMDAHLSTRDVQLLYQFQGGKVEIYPLQKGSIDATIKNNQLSANALMDWASYGTVSANSTYSLKDKKIQGKFSAALTDLAPLESLLPFLNDAQGSASANITFAGTSEKPEMFGNISLNKGSANLPKLGLMLRDVSLQVNSPRPGQVHVDGQLTSGDGTLMLKGDLENFGTPQWSWQSNIFGANIRFIEQPQMIATVSPNLKLSANANAINLTGSTEIPSARAALKTLPSSATRVSSDVTVIENERFAPDYIGVKKSIPFFTNIILYFGDDVRFKGFGLDTQLLGKVNVLKEEHRQTFVTGFVAVGKGNYKAYGQDLVIERGRLIFQGPYDNPGLDIRATRVLDSGMAGLEIGGTLQHPKSSVFAIPASTDSEAMAMLLTGKALAQSSQADAYSLIGAIGSLGMDNGSMMTSDIAHFLRIDEVAIKADKGLDQSALWMGKYVTPKLFIRYIVGLFDQTFSLGVRYQLNERLRLEAESGKNQSVDVIYKIER